MEGGGVGEREWRVIRVHTCSAALSAPTESDESTTHELSTIQDQSGSCHGDLTWALTF